MSRGHRDTTLPRLRVMLYTPTPTQPSKYPSSMKREVAQRTAAVFRVQLTTRNNSSNNSSNVHHPTFPTATTTTTATTTCITRPIIRLPNWFCSYLSTRAFIRSQRIRGGLLGDGISSFLAALGTSMPNTTFSQNNGVIALTRCASRRAGVACACWLIVFGILAKVSGSGACLVRFRLFSDFDVALFIL